MTPARGKKAAWRRLRENEIAKMPVLTRKARTKAICGDPQVHGNWQPHYQVWEPKSYGFKSCLQSHRVP